MQRPAHTPPHTLTERIHLQRTSTKQNERVRVCVRCVVGSPWLLVVALGFFCRACVAVAAWFSSPLLCVFVAPGFFFFFFFCGFSGATARASDQFFEGTGRARSPSREQKKQIAHSLTLLSLNNDPCWLAEQQRRRCG